MSSLRLALCAACFVTVVFGDITTTEPPPSQPIVSTVHGQVMGGMGESRDGRMFYEFKGIPYGQVKERFQPPALPETWDNVKYATESGEACIQYNPFAKEIVGVEDCLSLNVFSPKMPVEGEDKILLPVIVYLHPGLNNILSKSEFHPEYFTDEDVVIVVPNYRLGLFGFLSTNDMYAQGNVGLKDQVEALRWVQANIEQFGGDSSRVTIMGSGSGGADAFLHTLSPKSKGLIHNVVAMGGSTISRTTVIIDPLKQAKKLAKQVGCPDETTGQLVMCLKGMDAKEMLEKMTKLDPKEFNQQDVAWFGPSIEKPLEGQTENDLVLPDNPAKLLTLQC